MKNNKEMIKYKNENRFIKKLKIYTKKFYNPNFICADFETLITVDHDFKEKHTIIAWSISGSAELVEKKTKFKLILEYINACSDIKKAEEELIKSFMDELIKIQSNNKSRLYVYFHNLGNFDGVLLLSCLKRLNLLKDISIIIRSGTIIEIVYNKICFRDSFKLLPYSLEELMDNIFKKTRTKIPQINSIYDLKKVKKKIIKHVNSDSKNLYKILVKFSKKVFKLFKIPIYNYRTISTLSYSIFKNKFLKENSLANFQNFDVNTQNLIKQSYRGGIVEIYKPEGNDLYQYDINSAYPHAMQKSMPVGLPQRLNKEMLKKINIDDFFGFLTVKIKVDYNYIPFLGIRNKENPVNIYPYGIFTTTVFSEELKYAKKVNKIQIIEIYSAISFKKGKIFKSFVNKIYKKRLSSKSYIDKKLYKNILNFLYGRLALKDNGEKIINLEKEKVPLYDVIFNIRQVFKDDTLFYISDKKIRNFDNCVSKMNISDVSKKRIINIRNNLNRNRFIESSIHVSAAITAYSRIAIDIYKRKIIQKKGIIYYTDTDSIITNLKNIETSLKIGDLKLEKKIDWAYFLSPKIYFSKSSEDNFVKVKFKGMHKESIKKTFANMNIAEVKKKFISNNDLEINVLYDAPIQKQVKNLRIISGKKKINLKLQFKKRYKIYDKNGFWFETKPVRLK